MGVNEALPVAGVLVVQPVYEVASNPVVASPHEVGLRMNDFSGGPSSTTPKRVRSSAVIVDRSPIGASFGMSLMIVSRP